MPRENTEPQLAGHIRGACLAGALVAAVVAAAAQSPTSPRLTGEAPAPARRSACGIEHRPPIIRCCQWPPRGRSASGQRGVGPRASGGQWPPRRDGLRRHRPRAAAAQRRHAVGGPAVRPRQPRGERRAPRSQAPARRRQVRDAAKLASQKVMAKPLAQMPYQTRRRSGADVPAGDAVENYRRDLDLATATAHVSYTTAA